MQDKISLTEIGFTFAVDNIKASYGHYEVVQVHWSGKNGKKTQTPIELVLCDSLVTQGLALSN